MFVGSVLLQRLQGASGVGHEYSAGRVEGTDAIHALRGQYDFTTAATARPRSGPAAERGVAPLRHDGQPTIVTVRQNVAYLSRRGGFEQQRRSAAVSTGPIGVVATERFRRFGPVVGVAAEGGDDLAGTEDAAEVRQIAGRGFA